MSHLQILNALDVLIEYPDLMEYIKAFDSPAGFMYTKETDPQRIDYVNRLDELLDAESHSGGSWGCMMRGIQAVLNGLITVEYLEEQSAEEVEHMKLMHAKNVELRKARAAEAQAEADEAKNLIDSD
jgi:hypothetical protein